jgi:CheY-like chemotaxis protein
VLLIVDDDVNFCRVLLDLAHQEGFKGIVALGGEEALALAREYQPSAVTLDIGLRDISGWKVLDALRVDPATRSIPVHIITVFDDGRDRVERSGASFLTKPASKGELEDLFNRIRSIVEEGARHLLVVEDDPIQRSEIVKAVGHDDVVVHQAATVEEARVILAREPVECIVLDLRLAGASGFKLLDHLRKSSRLRRLPVIVYTAADLNAKEVEVLKRARCEVVAKGREHAAANLLVQVQSFLGKVGRQSALRREVARGGKSLPRPVGGVPGEARGGGAPAVVGDSAPAVVGDPVPSNRAAAIIEPGGLAGRLVLVVDDDVRNVFALTAMLERHGMRVLPAENGEEALELIERWAGQIDVILLDIMMPEIDGYETVKRIRHRPGLESVPIIALTAKAMKGDRERCLEAGATDYVAKPVASDRLLHMLRTWLNRS